MIESDNRVFRRLTIDQTQKTTHSSPSELNNSAKAASGSKDELAKIFSQEIEAIIEVERNAVRKVTFDKLNIEFDEKYKKAEKSLIKDKDEYQVRCATIDSLILSVTSSYREKIAEDISGLEKIMVEIVFEALYKILGKTIAERTIIEKVIQEAINKRKNDAQVNLRVCESDFLFLMKNFPDSEWVNSLSTDDRLKKGEIILDDTVSLYEIGLLSQLDRLREKFIAMLREEHAI